MKRLFASVRDAVSEFVVSLFQLHEKWRKTTTTTKKKSLKSVPVQNQIPVLSNFSPL